MYFSPLKILGMDQILNWFYQLSSPEQVFWAIAIASSVLFFFILISTFLIGDTDIDGDMDGGAGFQFFTFKNGVAFFAIFGWVGISCLHNGFSLITSIIIAGICGLFMMFIAAGIFFYINRLQSSGNLDYNNAINATGEVYLEVGSNRSKMGKVQINIQGSSRDLNALTDSDLPIKRGTLVIVESVTENGILIIKPLV